MLCCNKGVWISRLSSHFSVVFDFADGQVVTWGSSVVQHPSHDDGSSAPQVDSGLLLESGDTAAVAAGGNGLTSEPAVVGNGGAFSYDGGLASSEDGTVKAAAATVGTEQQAVQAPVQPVAASIKPRLFVIQRDGGGYELLDPEVFTRYAVAAVLVHPDCIHKTEQLQGGQEAGMLCHTFLYPKAVVNPGLQPLPLADTCKAVPCEVKVPACLTSLQRPTHLELPLHETDVPGDGYVAASGSTVMGAAVQLPAQGLKLPRIAAVSPANQGGSSGRTRTAAGTGGVAEGKGAVAVVVVRQVMEWPELTPERRAAAEHAVEACQEAQQAQAGRLATRVPPVDDRSEEELAEEREVGQLLQGLGLEWPAGYEAAVAGVQQQAAAAAADGVHGGTRAASEVAPKAGSKKELK